MVYGNQAKRGELRGVRVPTTQRPGLRLVLDGVPESEFN